MKGCSYVQGTTVHCDNYMLGDHVKWTYEDWSDTKQIYVRRYQSGIVIGFVDNQICILVFSKNPGGESLISFPLDSYGCPIMKTWKEPGGIIEKEYIQFAPHFNIKHYIPIESSKRGINHPYDYNIRSKIRDNFRYQCCRGGFVALFEKITTVEIVYGTHICVNVKTDYSKTHKSIKREHPIVLHKPQPLTPSPPPPKETRMRLCRKPKHTYTHYQSWWIDPIDCVLLTSIPIGPSGIMTMKNEYDHSRYMLCESSGQLNSIEENIFVENGDSEKEYFVKELSKMEKYVYKSPPPPTPPPPPTWAEKNPGLYSRFHDPFEMTYSPSPNRDCVAYSPVVGDIFMVSDTSYIGSFKRYNREAAILGSAGFAEYVIVVGMYNQTQLGKFHSDRIAFPIYAKFIGIGSKTGGKQHIHIGKNAYRNYPMACGESLIFDSESLERPYNVAEFLVENSFIPIEYFMVAPKCIDQHKDRNYINQEQHVYNCSRNHCKKTAYCNKKIETIHPVTKGTLNRLCMVPCVKNKTGMCESCCGKSYLPKNGCYVENCLGPFVLGKTVTDYQEDQAITEIRTNQIISQSEFAKNNTFVKYM